MLVESTTHVRIANKTSDISVPQPDEVGTRKFQRYQHEPNNQVVDLSRGFNLSKQDDYDEVVEALKKKPRLAVFKAWLSHLDKVVELTKLQQNNNRGFIVISEPPTDHLEESNNTLEEKISGLGFERLGVGMCSDGPIVNYNLNSQLLTNINEMPTSLKKTFEFLVECSKSEKTGHP